MTANPHSTGYRSGSVGSPAAGVVPVVVMYQNGVQKMHDLTIFEAGMKSEAGRYAEFITSPDREKVEEYIEIMKTTKPVGMTIIFLEKTYQLVSTTPHIIGT